MSRQISERLRAAYEAKAGQVTTERLEQLAARRQQSLLDGSGSWNGTDGWRDGADTSPLSLFDGAADEPASLELGHRPTGTRHAHWLAPALAAAAVAAIAVAVTAVATWSDNGKQVPNPPATQVTSPSPSTPPAPSPSASRTEPPTVITPPYLPAGRTGGRGEVPWSVVGAGWRLVLPTTDAGTSAAASLYLYDPAGGRYLINGRLPAGATLLAWSPDGTRAMISSGSDAYRYQEVTLRSGELTSGFAAPLSSFVSYTQPKGLAVLVAENPDGTRRLFRYSLGGHLERTYATELPGQGKLYPENALYLPDGAEFVSSLVQGPLVLMSNDGRLVRTYEMPKGYKFCRPLKWWTETSMLERCSQPGEPSDALYLQPTSGGAPTLLTTTKGRYQMGYRNAWPISNGHTLLENTGGCGNGGYDILLEDGTTRPLRGPAGLPPNARIINVDGDRVTFEQKDFLGCGGQVPHYHLVDYDLVTGATSTLLDGTASMTSWPDMP